MVAGYNVGKEKIYKLFEFIFKSAFTSVNTLGAKQRISEKMHCQMHVPNTKPENFIFGTINELILE